jgi:hypothetical protein
MGYRCVYFVYAYDGAEEEGHTWLEGEEKGVKAHGTCTRTNHTRTSEPDATIGPHGRSSWPSVQESHVPDSSKAQPHLSFMTGFQPPWETGLRKPSSCFWELSFLWDLGKHLRTSRQRICLGNASRPTLYPTQWHACPEPRAVPAELACMQALIEVSMSRPRSVCKSESAHKFLVRS